MKAAENDRLSELELIGQMSCVSLIKCCSLVNLMPISLHRCLMFGATDTTSGVMARIFHVLAQNPDVQERLRKEIRDARRISDGDLDYDMLQHLSYLDAVIRETLRL